MGKFMAMRVVRSFVATLLFVSILVNLAENRIADAAPLSQSSDIQLSVKAGFDGYYRHTHWVPVQISVSNRGRPLDAIARITVRGAASVNFDSPIQLPTRSEKRIVTYVLLPRFAERITVELLDESGQRVALANSNVLRRVDERSLLYAIVAPDLGDLGFLEGISGGREESVVADLDITDLPRSPVPWQAIDILIFNNVDTGALTAEQTSALTGWVQLGGQLVVTGGPTWRATTAGLAELLPVAIEGTVTRDDLPALSREIGTPFRDPGPYVLATSTLRQGELILHEDGLPILASRSVAGGTVFFLALDPQLAPLADWDGSELLWSGIASGVPMDPYWTTGIRDARTASSAVATLPFLTLPSGAQLILFLLAYILAIGPISYFVLKRSRRLELAWITTPTIIIIFTALAYVIGFRARGNDVIINQLSVVSGSIEGDLLRRQTLIGLYSPRRSRYDLRAESQELIRPFDDNNGDLWGGGVQESVERGESVLVKDILIDVSGVATLVADGTTTAPGLTGTAKLEADARTIELLLRNDGQTLLEQVTVLIGALAIPVGDLAPGANWREVRTLDQPTASTSPSARLTAQVSASSGSLASHYATILGGVDYSNDQALNARWQLLMALEEPFGGESGSVPAGAVTVVAWSDSRLLELTLSDERVSHTATALYLMDVPVRYESAGREMRTVPEALWSWEILASSGGFQVSPNNIDLYDGWFEIEYVPWPLFQALEEVSLGVRLTQHPGSTAPVPNVQIWDWGSSEWSDLSRPSWGVTEVVEPTRFLGPRHAVRLRVDSRTALQVDGVFPVLSGRFR